MELINQSAKILKLDDNLTIIELAGRTCYNSTNKMNEKSAFDFIKKLIKAGHESVLEHGGMTVELTTNRAIANQLVRHRIASYSQESTRYVKEHNQCILSELKTEKSLYLYSKHCEDAITLYNHLLNSGESTETARDVLPLGLATKIVITANYRQWRHIFNERLTKFADIKMRLLMQLILNKIQNNKIRQILLMEGKK